MKYVERAEIILNKQAVKNGAKKDNYHYVAIIESFKALIEDPSMIRMMNMKTRLGNEDNLYDLKC